MGIEDTIHSLFVIILYSPACGYDIHLLPISATPIQQRENSCRSFPLILDIIHSGGGSCRITHSRNVTRTIIDPSDSNSNSHTFNKSSY